MGVLLGVVALGALLWPSVAALGAGILIALTSSVINTCFKTASAKITRAPDLGGALTLQKLRPQLPANPPPIVVAGTPDPQNPQTPSIQKESKA